MSTMEEPVIISHPNYKCLNYKDFVIIDSTYSPNFKYDLHHDGPARISIVLQGDLTEKVSRQNEYATTSSIVYKPEGVEHCNTFGPKGARIISIIYKRTPLLAPTHFDDKQDWVWFHNPIHTSQGIQFLHALDTSIQMSAVEESITELTSTLFKAPHSISKVPPPWLKHITNCIQDEYDQSLRVKDLAKSVQVHPVYLARVFRQHFGCSVKEYLHNVRMRKVLDALSAGKQSISEIAYDCGFADQSHLNRLFKSKIRSTPKRFNKMVKTIME